MHLRLYILGLLALWTAFSTPLWAKDTLTQTTLSNGLTVFIIQDPSSDLVSIHSYVRTGSLFETPAGSGISHYLEHLVAGGATSRHTEKEYEDTIAGIGAVSNAYTTYDHTSYFINTTPPHLQTAINIMSDWLSDSQFEPAAIDRERQVITREMEQNEADLDRRFFLECQTNFYRNHPYRNSVIGFLNQFNQITRDDLIRYYKTNYVPSNMFIIIGGNIDPEKTLAMVQATFGQLPQLPAPGRVAMPEQLPFSTRYAESKAPAQVTRVSFRFPTVGLLSPDLYPLDLLDFILGHGDKSLLYEDLVLKKGLAYSLETSSMTPVNGPGFFEISVTLDRNKYYDFRDALFAHLSRLKKSKLAPERIQRAQKQKLTEDIFSIKSIDDKIDRLAQSYLSTYSTKFNDAYIAKFKSVTAADLQRVAQTYFHRDKLVVTLMRPMTGKTATAAVTVAPPPVRLPEKIVLPNGIRILLNPDSSLPRTWCSVYALGGLRAETPAVNGISNLTAMLLGRESKTYSHTKITELVENRGAVLNASAGNNTLYLTLACLSEDVSSLLPIFCDAWLNPQFSATDLKQFRPLVLKAISERADDWYSQASYEFKKAFFSNHPYAMPLSGEKEPVSKLQLTDITRYYKQLQDPANMVITISGDFNRANVMNTIKNTFGKLPGNQHPGARLRQPISRALNESPAVATHALNQQVAVLMVGCDGAKINASPLDLVKRDMLDAVLSGMSFPGGRLHPLLRGKGLVYQVHATTFTGLEPGYFLIYALTTPDKIEEVRTLIFEQINAIKTETITQEELEKAKAQVLFQYLDNRSSLPALAMISATDELYNRGCNYFLTPEKLVSGITAEDIQNTAKHVLENFQVFTFLPKAR